MGCCGVSVTDDKKKNDRYTRNQNIINYQNNPNNNSNQNASINVYPTQKPENPNQNKVQQYLTNTRDNINNNSQQISMATMNPKQQEDKNKKEEKFKSIKNITILDNVKEYLPADVTREEIEEMVLSAIGDSVVNEVNFQKGKNLKREHVEAIIDIIYMSIIGRNNGDKNYEDLLHDVKLKIGFCDVNKESIRNIMFKGQNPTDAEIEQVLEQFRTTIDPKLFVIELLD